MFSRLEDEQWMARALELARLGFGLTNPNPCVGAVLVKDGRLIGEGAHLKAGEAHAEVNSIRDAKAKGNDPSGATMYVTLEPCSTHGRTPPCTQLIMDHHIARVVVASVDPNPDHAGVGLKILEDAGIDVAAGVLEEEADALNRWFFYHITTKRPWVILKVAMSSDGYLARPADKEGNVDQWVSGIEARKEVHALRANCDAVLVGAETARKDDPQLTVRDYEGPLREEGWQPWRVVVTKSANLPDSLKLISDEYKDRTLVYQSQEWSEVLKDLGSRGCARLLVEGGAQVVEQLIRERLVNELVLYVNPELFAESGEVKDLPRALYLKEVELETREETCVGNDLKTTGVVRYV